MTRSFRRLIGLFLALTLFAREFGITFLDLGVFHGVDEVAPSTGLHLDDDTGCHTNRCSLGSVGTAPRLAMLWFDSTIVPCPTTRVTLHADGVTAVVLPFDRLPPSRSPPISSLS